MERGFRNEGGGGRRGGHPVIFVSFLREFQRDWKSRNPVRECYAICFTCFVLFAAEIEKARFGLVELSSLRASIFSYES